MIDLRLIADAPTEQSSMPDPDRLESDVRFFLAISAVLASWIALVALAVAGWM